MSKKIILTDELEKKIYFYYIEKNLSRDKVAKELNIGLSTCCNFIKELNLKKTKEQIKECREKTFMEEYGVTNASNLPEVRAKIGKKNRENAETRVLKIKETKKKRYHDPNWNNMEKNRATKKFRYNIEGYNNRDKYKETMLSKYDVDNGFKLSKVSAIHKENIFEDKKYSDTFREIFNDRDKAIALLQNKSMSYFDLSKEFNAPYYVVQMWATKLDVRDLIKHNFEGKSTYEDEIISFLQDLGIHSIERNTKEYLDGQEIDIYLPEYKIGIEFNGTFWHSDLYKDPRYHLNKSLKAEECGIRLIHIYEYEWTDEDKQNKIKSLIKIALGKADVKIYARQCDIRQITDKEAEVLNNSNHLQNHRKAHITYGLFYKNKLVQLMSFSKNKKYEWEIIRGCPASNNIVIGGVSKLFKHFIKEQNPSEVFSYCDFNKFDGHGYEKLGMNFIGYTGPDMKYIIKGKVVNRQPNRYKEVKSKIDARIYGAGSKKYLWKK